MNRLASTAAALCVFAVGVAALWQGTDGWSAWTAETARRLKVAENPIPLPALDMHDAVRGSGNLPGSDTPFVLIDFIYTRCPTVCLSMGAEFRALQTDLEVRGLGPEVSLLSITFDPQDTQQMLGGYLERFAADTRRWTAASIDDGAELDALLRTLGVVVIPEPTVGFVHNAAVYLVHEGKVAGIYDFDARTDILAAIESLRERGLPEKGST